MRIQDAHPHLNEVVSKLHSRMLERDDLDNLDPYPNNIGEIISSLLEEVGMDNDLRLECVYLNEYSDAIKLVFFLRRKWGKNTDVSFEHFRESLIVKSTGLARNNITPEDMAVTDKEDKLSLYKRIRKELEREFK
uniref:Uncharacterized protein n=1 Tax=Aeromonas phage CC2 TaxID=1204516 RepID=I6WB60_9CAUD|nr:hypothetical protein F485_gp011 [Aeromonas phage CC2]AFN39155.1 hypothetical protein CC2_248 [Aeromonas phage CC2]